jgi:lipoate-protein ligase A
MQETLRVIDFGEVSPLRSQTLWHAIAHGVSAGSPPTLSFCRPSHPYVSIGFHRRLDELDLDWCRREGLAVFRRMVGGGPVYLDREQHFFQISVPETMTKGTRPQTIRALLSPAVEAFRAVGVDAHLDRHSEISVGTAKICGHAAGQIGSAVVVVGNLITGFDHAAAARIIATPTRRAADEYLALMRRYVMATPADPERFRQQAVRSYGLALGLAPLPGDLTEHESDRLAELDRRFVDQDWLEGTPGPAPTEVKVRAGVSVALAGREKT